VHGRLRIGCLAVAAAVAATVLLGCDQAERVTSAAPPTVVCGTTLNATPAGAVLVDATRHHMIITTPSVRGLLFIKVSDDCAHGAGVSWTPAQAATLMKEADARDGLPAAVVLQPTTPTAAFTVAAERNGTVVAQVPVRLTAP
jgi:hypothetical protein